MKQRIRHKIVLGLMLLTALVSLVPTAVFAAGNSVSLTPATGSSQPGDSFTVSVDGFVGSSWFGTSSVSGTLNFPASLLKVTSVSTSGTTFSGGETATPNNTNGTITFSGSTAWWTAANNQTVHLFTITFQSLNAGTASVNFSNAQYDTGAAVTSGGSYSIVAPTPPPAPSPQPSPKPAPKPSTPPKPTTKITIPVAPVITPVTTPTPENTPAPVTESDGGLKIENVKVTATRQDNNVSWTLNSPDASPVLTLGTSKSKQDDQTVTKQDDGSYLADFSDLKMGTLYYFTIKAATPNNLQGATYSGTFTTRGYPVQLTIKQNNLLLPGAKVAIGERSFVANKNAIVTTELGDGNYTATITPPGESSSQSATFTVAKKTIPSSGSPDIQSFILNISTGGGLSDANSSLLVPVIAGAVALAAAVAGVIGFIIIRRRKEQEDGSSIDSDLLSANYGTAVDERRTNTPQPNLDMHSAMGPVAAAAETVPVDVTPVMAEATPVQAADAYVAQPADPAIDPALQPAQVGQPVDMNAAYVPLPADPAQFDPSGLPLPPADPSMATMSTPDGNQAVDAQYSEGGQLSPEMAQVEAAGEIQEDEPSAIYDASTGELDIIHHHTHTEAAPQPEAEVSEALPSEPYTAVTAAPEVAPEQTVVDPAAYATAAAVAGAPEMTPEQPAVQPTYTETSPEDPLPVAPTQPPITVA